MFWRFYGHHHHWKDHVQVRASWSTRSARVMSQTHNNTTDIKQKNERSRANRSNRAAFGLFQTIVRACTNISRTLEDIQIAPPCRCDLGGTILWCTRECVCWNIADVIDIYSGRASYASIIGNALLYGISTLPNYNKQLWSIQIQYTGTKKT